LKIELVNHYILTAALNRFIQLSDSLFVFDDIDEIAVLLFGFDEFASLNEKHYDEKHCAGP
jgi:hypothetical protein